MTGTDTEHGVRSSDDDDDDQTWWATTWPLERFDWVRLGVAFVAFVAVGVVVGEVLTNWSALSGLADFDQNLAQDVADGRTPLKDDLAHWGAFIADTPVKIGISVVVAGFLLWKLRRWREAVLIGLPLIFEASAYITTSYIVDRPRPDVERLLESPVDTSFPSGHVAAAAVYGALGFIVLWHTRNVAARVLAVVLIIAAPLIVGWARIYQGMHFFTDVVAGIVLGFASVALSRYIVGAPRDAEDVLYDDRDQAPVEPAS